MHSLWDDVDPRQIARELGAPMSGYGGRNA